ncbi:4Fe-4S binding protein [Desulfohalobium retbaense]|uniref:Iron-sulfur binding protein n=1 Tax=Desulfohalobium retbaense (strain ATCC 49708 / DSM 5692 / JCM 16813 / HR100) TaxID=485915 RepID=C8X2B8_DESRD|nr:4Fe-4S dicluster domain-containing protein [Desulfohalobium retbaense]ACV68565.1 iron-sulfur binding protein [Desulfohalobium retbaense DSM 5692]
MRPAVMRRSLGVLVCLLLAAHSLRLGDFGLSGAWLGLGGLVLTRQAWVRWVVAAACLWGVWIWGTTTVELVQFRLALGAPWARLAGILGTVFTVTAATGWLFVHSSAERISPRHRSQQGPLAAIFLLTVVLLALARRSTPFPILLADRFWPGSGWLEILVLGLYAVWAGTKFLDPEQRLQWRPRLWGFFSVVFFAQLALGLAGLEQFLMSGDLHLPVPALIAAGPVYRGGGLFMPVLFTVTVLLVGPAWCSHLCYIGAWDDGLSRSGGKRPAAPPRWTLWLRLILLFVVVATAWGLRALGLEPRLAVAMAGGFGLAGVAVMLVGSRRQGMMVHCTTFCPIGIVANILSRLSPWRLRIGSGCSRCGRCQRVCRYNALDTEDFERGRPGLACTLCGDCLAACPEGQLRLDFPGLSAGAAHQAFVVLIVALHAVFLGVARI